MYSISSISTISDKPLFGNNNVSEFISDRNFSYIGTYTDNTPVISTLTHFELFAKYSNRLRIFYLVLMLISRNRKKKFKKIDGFELKKFGLIKFDCIFILVTRKINITHQMSEFSIRKYNANTILMLELRSF